MQKAPLNRFVIIAPSHSGAQLLRATLNRHPDCFVYSAGDTIEKLHAFQQQESDLAVKTLGFVINTCQQPFDAKASFWQSLLADQQLKIILLHRQNLLQRYLLMLAAALDEQQLCQRNFTFTEFDEEFSARRRDFDQLCQYFESHARLQISYECLTQDWKHQIGYFQSFVGLKIFDIAIESQASLDTLPRRLIVNAKKLYHQFKHHDCSDFFISLDKQS